MKKEASGKKNKWLWLVLGAVALLAVAGVVLALVFGGNKAENSSRPDLYWNVDRQANVNPDTGLSIREPAEDGNYYIRFAHDGEQVEIPVADKKLVNYIDGLDVMNLVLDKAGFVVDIFQVKEVATVIGEGMYVQTAGTNAVTINSAITMNGRKLVVPVSDDLKIYNVSGRGEFVGKEIQPAELNAMDSVSVYAEMQPEDSEEDPVITHIFVTKQPAQSPVYWRADQFYSNKKTTRVPDENGAYTIPFYCNGETVELKCKDVALVTQIDSVNRYFCHFGLELDDDGYIIAVLDSFIGSRTLLQCERFDITALDDEGNYTATSLIKNDGSEVEGTVSEDCPIYDVSFTADAEHQLNRKVDSLQMGDRVCIWTDTLGNPVLIYVVTRLVDSPAYWNVSRKYDSTNRTTSRTPNADGYYEIELLKAGSTKKEIYYFKTEADATEVDYTTDRCVGLKVGEGNVVEYAYNMECIFGSGYFCRGYYATDITASVCSFLSNAGSGYTMNGVLANDCKIWNVSTVGTYGEETTLQYGDSVYAAKKPTGEIINAYVTRRTLGVDTMYWRLSDRKYDATNKVSTRTPNADGYYVYLFAHEGKQVELKTKDKKIANYLDSLTTPAVALVVKNGIIKEAHDSLYAVGGFRYSGWYVSEITDTSLTIYNKKGREETWDLAENCQVINVSPSFVNYKGEKTKLQLEDYVYVYFDIPSDIAYLFVWGRETSKIAWPVAPQYDSGSATTLREPDADGWYYVDLAVDGKIRTYKTKNKDIMSGVDSYITAFGIETSGDVIKYYSSVSYVQKVQGAGLSNYTVTSVSGNTVNAVCTIGSDTAVGTKKTIKLASNVKIYDVSADAANRGAPAKIKAGDKIFTYTTEEGEKDTIYVYITAHSNRKGGYLSLCDHCNKVVYWNPYHSGANVTSYNAHYYLASDVEMYSQLRVYNTAREFETVLDLNGYTLRRDNGRAALVRYGDTLTIIDSVGGGKIETSGQCSMGTVLMVSDGVINLHDGTIHHVNGEDPADYSYAGGLVYANIGTFNMYGGTLLNGEAFADKVHEAYGGAMRLTNATFNMYGGTITGGKANSFTYTTEAGKSKTNASYGGNIYAEKKATVNIYDGVIEAGTAGNRGGNIYAITNSVVNISGGKIIGGVVGDRGGNIFSTDTIVNISGGEVLDGMTTDRFGGNIMAQGVDGQLNISGGKVSGGKTGDVKNTIGGNICLMYSNLHLSGGEVSNGDADSGANISLSESGGKGSSLKVSGGLVTKGNISAGTQLSTVVITGGKLDCTTAVTKTSGLVLSGKPVVTELKLGETVRAKVDKLESGADIAVTAVGTFTEPGAADYATYFKAVDTTKKIGVNTDGSLKVYHPDELTAYCDHCQQEIGWTPWDGTAEMSGHYYVKDDMTLTDYVYVKSGQNLILNLNGKTVTAPSQNRAFSVYGDLYVMDKVGGGAITKGVAVNGRGGNVYVENGTFTLYSGNITDGVSDAGYGGNVYVTGGGTVNIKGGTISGGTGSSADNVYAMYSKLNISGGEIIGDNTGAVPSVAAMGYNAKVAYVNISGGKLTGSVKNLSVTGSLAELTITGGELEGISGVSKVAKFEVSGTPVIKNLQLGETTVMNVGELKTGADIVINKLGTFTTAFATKAAAEAAKAYFTPYGVDDTLGVTTENALEVIGKPVITKSIKCEKCGQTVEFTSWNGATFSASGHYFLEQNVNLTAEILIPADQDITLDLNGFELKAAPGYRVFNLEGQLTVQDSSVAGTGKIVGTEVAKEGATIYVNKSIFNLYSGTVTGGTATGTKYGGNFCVLGGAARVNLYGGTVSEGTAARGGNFYIYSGKVTLSGDAQVVDGTAVAAGTNTGRAGNIYVTGQYAYVTVTDNAVVSRGDAATEGGNIYAMYAKNVAISGNATISDGTATAAGNMYISGTTSSGATTLDISGGTISNGGVFLGASSIVNVSGGTLDCAVNASSIATMTVSGAPTFTDLKLGNNEVLTLGTLSQGASIKLNMIEGVITAELADAGAVAQYFSTVEDTYKVVATADNKYLEILPKTPVTTESCPHCTGATWLAWDGSTVTSGHYYLTGPVSITGAELAIAADTDVVIDLRGNTITATDVRAFNVKGILSIVDTVGDGKIVGNGVPAENTSGGVFSVSGGGLLNLYSGELAMTEVNNGAMRGGVVYVSTNSTFHMYGGAVRNGVADGNPTATSDLDKAGRGGNICNLQGALILEGGVIDGGESGYAGNIYNGGAGASTTISGTVVISNGTALSHNAGNLYLEKGILNISGGRMTGGKAAGMGDNILMTNADQAELTITGGILEGVTRLGSLTKFALSGAPVIEEMQLGNPTKITELGTLTSGASIGVSKISSATNLTFTDALTNAADVLNYFHAADATKKVVVDTDSKLSIVEACPCGCGKLPAEVTWVDPLTFLTDTGAIAATTTHRYITEDVHLRLNGNFNVTDAFQSVRQLIVGKTGDTAKVVIDLNGFTWSSQHRLYIEAGSEVIIMDSSAGQTGIMTSTGNANAQGRLIFNCGTLNLYSGTLTMTDVNAPTVTKGGVVYQSKGTFNMYGGTITGGKVDGDGLGGNVCVNAGTFNMYGGTISNGEAKQGGNVYMVASTTFNLSGGTITGGVAQEGEDVYMGTSSTKGSTLNASGGTVAGEVYVPTAKSVVSVSGNIKIGKLNLQEDALVKVGTLFKSAKIGVKKATAFTDVLANADKYLPNFTGAGAFNTVTVTTDGKLIVAEGCPCGCGQLAKDVTWVDPMTFLTNSGAIAATTTHAYIIDDVHLRLTENFDVTTAFGKAKQIIIGKSADAARVVIDLNGFTWSSNHRLYVEAGSEAVILDSSAEQDGMMTSTGSAGAHGRVLFINGTLNLYGGTITMTVTDAPEVAKGGVIYQSKGTFNMYGGTVTGGKVTGDSLGGNIAVNTGTFNLNGGTVSNGDATYGYNIYLGKSVTFANNGGTVVGNAGDDTLGIYRAK